MIHIDRLIAWVKAAGAGTEAQSDRNGFLSYHAETHAVGLGIAAGFAAVAFGMMSLFGIVYGAAVHGRVAWSGGKRRRIVKDAKQEPHYALGGIVFGAAVGVVVRVVIGMPPVPDVAGVVSALL